jgi:hypothetical protein
MYHTEQQVSNAIARAKSEILEDIASGIVPESVTRFADLYHYVDANRYGGLNDDEWTITDPSEMVELSEVVDAVDEWLQERAKDALLQ